MLVNANCEGVDNIEPDDKWSIMTSHVYPDGLQLRIITLHPPMELYCVGLTTREWPVTNKTIKLDRTLTTVKMHTENPQWIKFVECYKLEDQHEIIK